MSLLRLCVFLFAAGAVALLAALLVTPAALSDESHTERLAALAVTATFAAQLPAPTPLPTATPTQAFIAPTLLPVIAAPTLSAQPAAQSISILMYHKVQDLPPYASAFEREWVVAPASLDAQLNYLATKGYTTISLDQAVDGLSGRAPLPAKPIVLTFDDGWRSQYVSALPLLKKYRQTATFYIVSGYMGYNAYMDWAMTEELKNAGMTIAAHTIDHADLTRKSPADLEREVRDSKVLLESRLNISITHFAYPFGAYNNRVVEAVKQAGYRTATTVNPASLKNPVSPLLLPRLRVSYRETLADFARKLQ